MVQIPDWMQLGLSGHSLHDSHLVKYHEISRMEMLPGHWTFNFGGRSVFVVVY